jgi:hypothetical protein
VQDQQVTSFYMNAVENPEILFSDNVEVTRSVLDLK